MTENKRLETSTKMKISAANKTESTIKATKRAGDSLREEIFSARFPAAGKSCVPANTHTLRSYYSQFMIIFNYIAHGSYLLFN